MWEDKDFKLDSSANSQINDENGADPIKTDMAYMIERINGVEHGNEDDMHLSLSAHRHLYTQHINMSTLLMWILIISPIISGLIVNNKIMTSIDLGFVNEYLILLLFNAVFGITDVIILHKKYKGKAPILALIVVFLPPIYMILRKKYINEVNYQYIAWIIFFLIFIWA